MKYAFIFEHHERFSIATMCRVLGVSRQAYCLWRRQPVSERARRDQELTRLIEPLFHANNESYGSPAHPSRTQA